MNLDVAFVEKDFWVVEVLRAATQTSTIADASGIEQHVGMIFKGGTSLSRVYQLIARFSEDVDLLVAFPADASKSSRDRFLKGVCARVMDHLGLDEAASPLDTSTKGVKRNVHYLYPTSYPSPDVSDGVLLEMGSRGGPFPAERHTLRSWAAEHAIANLGDTSDTWAEFATVDVEVLAPERTLLEKLALLHDASTRATADEGSVLQRSGRHLYDVHSLLQSPRVRDALEELGAQGRTELCEDIDARSQAAGFSHTARPVGGYATGPMYVEGSVCAPHARRGWDSAMTLVHGERPEMGTCLATVREYEHLL